MSTPLELSRQEYATQDAILQYISSNFIKVQQKDKKDYKNHLNYVIDTLLEKMKEQDSFFTSIFQKQQVSGSFWDKLKVGKPEEFDFNFVLKLPAPLTENITISDGDPSYVTISVNRGFENLQKRPNWERYRKIENWLLNGNINADKVRFWMESVIDKAVRTLPEVGKKFVLMGDSSSIGKIYMIGRPRKSGPAITIEVAVDKTHQFNVDIVPAFEFMKKDWPQHVLRCPKTSPNTSWQVVPKPFKDTEKYVKSDAIPLLWRLSFHNQESHLIKESYHMKAILKFMKKLRDNKLDQNLLSSYAIKTVFLWEMDRQTEDFWKKPLSFLFLYMLRKLIDQLKCKNIPFYWDKRHNLIGHLSDRQRDQIYCTFQKAYNRISDGLNNHDQFAISKELLSHEESIKLRTTKF